MKVVAVLGSPHGLNGNTGQVLQAVLEGCETEGAQTQLFSLSELKLNPCRACNACHKTGICAIKDDFQLILQALEKADALVFASPNYIFSVSAQMKAFFDRCCGPLHCVLLKDKYGMAVVTSGGAESAEVEAYILRFLRALGCWTTGSVGASVQQLFDDNARAQIMSAARQSGKNLITAVKAKQTYPEQEAEKNSFFQVMKRLVESQKDQWPYEYEYWQKHHTP